MNAWRVVVNSGDKDESVKVHFIHLGLERLRRGVPVVRMTSWAVEQDQVMW